ncbi:hypothetical protein [Candidatus Sororendozoicomonas aggregata]|uniref:hypothetical protein n=1 Tax=Candidatus Sororendozoicomonas aggregata TaxID=3073239 RepID=UPI002ED04BDB
MFHNDWVRSAMFSPDSRHVVTASCDKTAKIWLLKMKRSSDSPSTENKSNGYSVM